MRNRSAVIGQSRTQRDWQRSDSEHGVIVMTTYLSSQQFRAHHVQRQGQGVVHVLALNAHHHLGEEQGVGASGQERIGHARKSSAALQKIAAGIKQPKCGHCNPKFHKRI